MQEMWLAFLNLPPMAQIAFVGACAFLGSFSGLLLLLHGRRAWYAWRLEVWRKRHLWPDGEVEAGPFGQYLGDCGHVVATLPHQRYEDCPVCAAAERKERRRLNGLVEVRRERLQ
mgnify:CR=1 FL=1